MVDAKWKKQSHKGMVTDSLVVLVVRDGNPKKIKGWNDLLRFGRRIVTPNPFTSGVARWNVMAAYGAWRKAGKTDKQAQANLLKLFRNVVVQDTSARASLNTFNSGKGDVLLAYENEALFARTQALNLQFVIPKATILIENPIAVIKSSPDAAAANAFLRFLRTPAAQQVFADNGYRPVVKSVLEKNRKTFPVRPGEFTIDQLGLGGWDKVQKRFFDPKVERHGAHPAADRRQHWLAVMSAEVALSNPRRARASRDRASTALSLGVVGTFLMVMVGLPIAALLWEASSEGKTSFWDAVSSPDAVAALKLTLAASLAVSALNAILGTVTAWVLVRDDFRGKTVVNAIIDLPFALPTSLPGSPCWRSTGRLRRSASMSRSRRRRSCSRSCS